MDVLQEARRDLEAQRDALAKQMKIKGAADAVMERRAEIPYELEALSAELSRADGLLASLADRLAPVVSALDVDPRAVEAEPGTKLGATIRELRLRVERMGDVLGAVHRGLEL